MVAGTVIWSFLLTATINQIRRLFFGVFWMVQGRKARRWPNGVIMNREVFPRESLPPFDLSYVSIQTSLISRPIRYDKLYFCPIFPASFSMVELRTVLAFVSSFFGLTTTVVNLLILIAIFGPRRAYYRSHFFYVIYMVRIISVTFKI